VELFIHLEAYAGAARAFDSYQIATSVFSEASGAPGACPGPRWLCADCSSRPRRSGFPERLEIGPPALPDSGLVLATAHLTDLNGSRPCPVG
jgi:hypothetical protein